MLRCNASNLHKSATFQRIKAATLEMDYSARTASRCAAHAMSTMTRYVNTGKGTIASVEFSPVVGSNTAFVQLRDAASVARFTALLAEKTDQRITAQTTLDGKPLLVTQGKSSPDALLDLLAQSGENLQQEVVKKKFDPWVIRSLLGFAGQSLQLASAFMRPPKDGKTGWANVDTSQFVFAATNLMANGINLVYRGQEVPDPHRLNFVKQQVNDALGKKLSAGETPINVSDDRLVLRDPDYRRRNAVTGVHGFMQKHSVNIGELGLRYVGAFGMAFPPKNYIGATAKAEGRKLSLHDANLRAFTGLSSIAGKTVALSSKIPDPYNPKGTSWLDGLREKMAFSLGGWIETAAFSALAYDSFVNTGPKAKTLAQENRGIMIGGEPHRDWLGGVGAAMFVTGYIARHWAPYGSRHVDMREVYAHTSDTLSRVDPAELPQALAQVSAQLADHFKDDPKITYATIYSKLSEDLYRYHPATVLPAVPVVPTDPEADAPSSQIAAQSAVHTAPPKVPVTARMA